MSKNELKTDSQDSLFTNSRMINAYAFPFSCLQPERTVEI